MSLNWKEINLILDELDLKGAQIQSVVQSAYDVMVLRLRTRTEFDNLEKLSNEGSPVFKKGETKQVLISLSSGACRINETFRAVPKSDKPLRFAQFLSSKIVNSWITDVKQLGDDRIIRLDVKRSGAGDELPVEYRLYIRLWSNAANFIVTNNDGLILDVMRRQPKRGEITGGSYTPEKTEPDNIDKPKREFEIRDLQGEGSFNKKIDEFYAEKGGLLSLEVLREQVRRNCEGSLGRITAALERLKEKEKQFANAEQLKIKGDEILSNIGEDKNSARMAQEFYDQYKKEKNALMEIQREIEQGELEQKEVTEKMERLLAETNPLILAKLLKTGGLAVKQPTGLKTQVSKKEKNRPGLTFKRGDWIIIVGRDANENDELLRRFVKGNDLWFHARDYHGSYVFIRQRSGKTVPLDIMLDAGNLALFYSKGRNNGAGDLFYTQVKYLRRVKNGAKGLVIPTQEKNLHVKLEETRLRILEGCRV
ncbi:MAG: NFACT RNA binding domain-containing protein [Treponema sp.]|nr:NFACT RNA binding domain-containing protein [Treponema sp.]